ncbi:hypothetical protein [Rhizobium lusitanum]|uniref:hypothetical protein n=1 Tax=Rhizobium lusitanum TaxID=293958 RepID=UPI001955FF17|nr:hypothetical protein [Rhizobium lusitanum]MBM7049693.1 hypothetical protein [Rhizobium lusitanum]
MSEIPVDIMQAAYDCARGIYLSVDDAYTPYMTDDDIEVIAKALLVERQRSDSLKALCDEMAKALEPFASAKDLMRCADNENIQDTDAAYSIKHRDIRKARAVIAIYRKEKEVGNG